MEDALALDLRTKEPRLDAEIMRKVETFTDYEPLGEKTSGRRTTEEDATTPTEISSSINSRLSSLDASVLWKRDLPKM